MAPITNIVVEVDFARLMVLHRDLGEAEERLRIAQKSDRYTEANVISEQVQARLERLKDDMRGVEASAADEEVAKNEVG